MNTEDSEFARIEREQAMRGVPDPIHHTDTSEPLMYIQGWNDCRQAMLVEQPAQQEPWLVFLRNNPKASCETVGAWLRGHAESVTGERFYFPQQPAPVQQEPVAWKHDCAALLTNDVELWIGRCPHCGKPRTTPQAPKENT